MPKRYEIHGQCASSLGDTNISIVGAADNNAVTVDSASGQLGAGASDILLGRTAVRGTRVAFDLQIPKS